MKNQCKTNARQKKLYIFILLFAVILLSFICLFIGPANMSPAYCIAALTKNGSAAHERIIWDIRIPRILAAIISGAGLSVSGLIMQTTLNNPMASPSVLGVSNAAVFGANLSIIGFAGGFLSTGNNISHITLGANPYATSLTAFIFSTISIMLILKLCKIHSFSPASVILTGIAVGTLWTAATSILQFYATDIGISAAVAWAFGDLGRATYKTDCIMAAVLILSVPIFFLFSWQYNALLSSDIVAKSMGVSVDKLRFISLFLASLITAVCVSFLGIIGFVGIICPHVTKKLIGQDHRYTIPFSILSGIFLLVLADTLSRSLGRGSALPVGAITSLLGAPFFITIIFSKEGY